MGFETQFSENLMKSHKNINSYDSFDATMIPMQHIQTSKLLHFKSRKREQRQTIKRSEMDQFLEI